MKLCVLGSGTAIPHPDRGASGYACVEGDTALLLECGPGSTRRWPRHQLSFTSVRGILVTHHHVDHCADLAAVLFGRNVPEPPVDTPLWLGGPAGHGALLSGLEALYGPMVSARAPTREVVELRDGDTFEVGPFSGRVREVRHAEGALGVRVTAGGRTLAFSGDTGPCDALVELCRGADLAMLECSYPASRPSRSHLCTTSAAEMAIAAGVGRLLLTHFYPATDAVDVAREVRDGGYGGELLLARDGDEIRV